jgi:DNA-binding NarL/FixJ family response regulator
MFLTEAGPALQLLLPHVGDACRAAEQSRAAADAAAALNLTSREVEVLQLLSEGLLARTIAARLGLSPRTVHKHLSNVYTKLGVHDRLVAVSFARERGLISV